MHLPLERACSKSIVFILNHLPPIESYLESLKNCNGPLTRYVKLRVENAPGMPGTFSPPPTSKKPLISDPSMHHDMCVTYVPWHVSGSLTHGGGENVPDIPFACATRNFTYLARGPLPPLVYIIDHSLCEYICSLLWWFIWPVLGRKVRLRPTVKFRW